MSRYKTTWSKIQEQMNEFALSHTVRYRDPLNKKRFAVPFKTAEKAKEKMDQLKRDGVKEIEITKDILRGKFKEVAEGTIVEDGHEDVSSSKRMAQVISEDAQLIIKELNKKSEEESLPTWWTNKLAVSAHNMNAARDYITDNIKEDLEEAISPEQLKRIRDQYKEIKTISPEKVKTLKNFLDRYSTDSLMQLAQANINFVSTMARSVMNKRKMGDPKHAGSMKEDAAADMERVAKLRIKQMMIQTKVQKMDKADPKNKTPLAIAKNDLDNIQMRMAKLKQRAEREKTRPQIAAEKEPEKNKEEIKERIEGLENKSDKSGIPYGILKQVYDRGMAAWKGGHRPGTTPQQWAFARVNSFITKGKTYHTADADLAKKARN